MSETIDLAVFTKILQKWDKSRYNVRYFLEDHMKYVEKLPQVLRWMSEEFKGIEEVPLQEREILERTAAEWPKWRKSMDEEIERYMEGWKQNDAVFEKFLKEFVLQE